MALYLSSKFIVNLRDKEYITSLLMFLFFLNYVYLAVELLIFLIAIIYLFLNDLFKNFKYKNFTIDSIFCYQF